MMGVKQSEMMWFQVVKAHRAVRYPDAFMLNIHLAARGQAGGFFWKSAWEKRPVKDTQLHFSSVIRNGYGEKACILVVHVDEIDTEKRNKGGEPPALPVEQILRYGNGDARS